ncbi:MAG: extracellular solute-binding protein [Gemmatimonadota bacterium]
MATLAVSLALGLAGAAGCGEPAPREPVVLELWALGREGEVVQELLPEFERRNPGVRVEVQQIPWSAAHEKLVTAYAGDAMPDVAQIGNTWISEFVALAALEPLDDRVAASDAIAPGEYFDGIWETNRVDGAMYGIPWYVDTRVLFYRSDVLAEVGVETPPDTWEGWVEALRRIDARAEEEAGPGAEGWAILLPLNEWAQPVLLGVQTGSPLLREEGRYGAFRDRRFRRGFEFYVGLFREGLAPPVTATQAGSLFQAFSDGWISAFISGPWNVGELRRRLPESRQDDWATTPLPAFDRPGPGMSLAGGSSLAIFRGSAHADLAWKLIEHLSSPERQVRFYELTGNLPARRAAWRAPELVRDRQMLTFFEQLRHVQPMPAVPEWEQIATAVADHAEAAVRGRMTIDEALASLDASVDRILEKRRWMMDRQEESTGDEGGR